MAGWGLCCNHVEDWPPVADWTALGALWLRSLVYDVDEFTAALAGLPPTVQVCALLTPETEGVGDDADAWHDLADRLLGACGPRLAAVEVLNEWDIAGVPPADAAARAVLVGRRVAASGVPGVQVVLGSVAGPDWASQLQQAASHARAAGRLLVRGAAFHPYAQRAAGYPPDWGVGELTDACIQARSLARLPLYVTEYGAQVEDCGSPEGHALYHARARRVLLTLPGVVMATVFAASDGAQPDAHFGLRDGDGVARPAWGACAALGAAADPSLPPLPAPDAQALPPRAGGTNGNPPAAPE